MENKTITASFQMERETKNTIRFQEISVSGQPIGPDEGAKIGLLYIQKSAFGESQAPKKIDVAIVF